MSFVPHALFWVMAGMLVLLAFMLIRLWQEYRTNLKFQLRNDPLTDLSSRLGLEEEMARMLAPSHADQQAAVLFIGLDGFRQVNDLCGHRAGDAFLKQVAMRIQGRLQRGDRVARVGGDEFAVFLRHAEGWASAEALAGAILEAIRVCTNADAGHVRISASAGISLYPEHGKDALTLLRLADMAMRRCKENGGGRCSVWGPQMGEADFRTEQIVGMIRSALDDDRFHMVFQPVLDRAGRIVHMEALVRIHDFLLGSIPPDQFMHVAEQTGLIHEIGEWIFGAVCAQARGWREEGFEGAITVNVSPAQLQAADFAAKVLGHLRSAALPGSALILEITESGMVHHTQRVTATLARLREAGVRVSLDDFGAGLTSFGSLRQLPVDSIKVHGSWTVRMADDAQSQRAVAEAVERAHQMGYQVVVEGIEERPHLEAARKVGCDLFQGYFLAPPLEAGDAAQVLAGERNPLAGMALQELQRS